MVRVVLRHLNGARSAQADVLDIDAQTEVVLGPAGAATVQVASSPGDLGDRPRARLIPVEGNGRRFVLVDLESPEGIYVNHKRVVDAVLLRPGDIIQLGEGGAEIEFGIEGVLL
jgi:hypothetical protein